MNILLILVVLFSFPLLHDIYVHKTCNNLKLWINFVFTTKPFENKQTANNVIALPPIPGLESEKPLIFEI